MLNAFRGARSISHIYTTSNLFIFHSLSLSFARSIDDTHDHDTITPLVLRPHDHDLLFRPLFLPDWFAELSWRRLISYELFPFLAALFARLRAVNRGVQKDLLT